MNRNSIIHAAKRNDYERVKILLHYGYRWDTFTIILQYDYENRTWSRYNGICLVFDTVTIHNNYSF